jgi:hypothetical protein
MPSRFALTLYEVSTWVIPLIVAITFHEAAHGFVAHLFGDDTAWRQGRVTFNPNAAQIGMRCGDNKAWQRASARNSKPPAHAHGACGLRAWER